MTTQPSSFVRTLETHNRARLVVGWGKDYRRTYVQPMWGVNRRTYVEPMVTQVLSKIGYGVSNL
jgi:hypothetical protein